MSLQLSGIRKTEDLHPQTDTDRSPASSTETLPVPGRQSVPPYRMPFHLPRSHLMGNPWREIHDHSTPESAYWQSSHRPVPDHRGPPCPGMTVGIGIQRP